jgi:hypothetical protein
MKDATGEVGTGPLWLHFDRTIKPVFQRSSISSDGGLLLHHELDDVLGLTDMAASVLSIHAGGRNPVTSWLASYANLFSCV